MLELGCGHFHKLTGIVTQDSPEVMPGSVLHRLGNARRNNARRERGPRRRMRLKSEYTGVSRIKFDDAGDLIAALAEGRHAHHSMSHSHQNERVPLRFSKPSGRQTEAEMCQSRQMTFARKRSYLLHEPRGFYSNDRPRAIRF